MQKYFKIYAKDYERFTSLSSFAALAGALLTTLLTGVIVDHFSERSDWTIPVLCIVKCVINIIAVLMIYAQQSSFNVSIAGLFVEYFVCRGWTSGAILIMKTVVDPSIAPFSVSMFMLTVNLCTSSSTLLTG